MQISLKNTVNSIKRDFEALRSQLLYQEFSLKLLISCPQCFDTTDNLNFSSTYVRQHYFFLVTFFDAACIKIRPGNPAGFHVLFSTSLMPLHIISVQGCWIDKAFITTQFILIIYLSANIFFYYNKLQYIVKQLTIFTLLCYTYSSLWKSRNVCCAAGIPPRALIPSATEPNFSSISMASFGIASSSMPLATYAETR